MKFPTKGSLGDTSLIEILKEAAQSGLTGIIRLEDAPVIKVIYFNNGTISFASSNDKADRLTEVLKRAGKLTPEQVQDAQGRLKPNVSLGKTLLELGYVSAKDLLWGAHAQVDGILHHLLFWSKGKYQVFEGTLPQEIVHLNLPVTSVIFQGITKTQNREWILQHIGSPDAVYAAVADFQEQNQTLQLPVSDVVSRLNGQSSLHEIAEASDLDTFEICKTVVALQYLDLARPIQEASLEAPSLAPELETPAEVPVETAQPEPVDLESLERTHVLTPSTIEETPATPSDSPETPAVISQAEPATLQVTSPVPEPEKSPEPEQPVEDSTELEAVYQQVLAVPEDEHVPMQSMARDSGAIARARFRWKRVAIILLVLIATGSGASYYVLKNERRARSFRRFISGKQQPVALPATTPQDNPVLREVPPEGPVRMLRNGRVADAARAWNDILSNEPHGYTVQLVIACQAKTVADTHRLLNYSNEIIVLPVNYKGQICHRVLFGKYLSKEEAEAAIDALPDVFFQQNSPASVVEISDVIF